MKSKQAFGSPQIIRIYVDWDEDRQSTDMSFHRAIRYFLVVLKFFCIFPLKGLLSWNPNDLRVDRFSVAYMAAAFLYLISAVETVCSFLKLLKGNVDIVPGLVFFVASMGSIHFFNTISHAWPKYVKYWRQQEKVFLVKPYPLPRVKFSVLLTTIGISMILICIVEHFFYILSIYHLTDKQITFCNATDKVSFFLTMVYNQKGHVFDIVGYIPVLAPVLVWTNFLRTISWNSTDIMIVVLSTALYVRFSQLNKRLWSTQNKFIIESEWRELRTHYGCLVDLTKATEKLLENMVLLSMSNNMYFICFLLFDLRRPRSTFAVQMRYWISTIYIIFRTLMVLYFGSSLNDISREPVRVLKLVPWNQYNLEVRRFIDQIQAERVSLSGRLFFLTKKFMLGMIGTVLTYEVVLKDHFKPKPEGNPSCTFHTD